MYVRRTSERIQQSGNFPGAWGNEQRDHSTHHLNESEQLELIDRILLGDLGAFEGIVSDMEGSVLRIAHGICNDPHQARDIAQDAFVAAFRQLRDFDPHRAKFSTWLLAITRNLALKSNRKLRRFTSIPADHSNVAEVGEVATGPDENIQWKETFAALDAALQQLPAPWRTAFTLTEIEGLTYEEAATIEAVPVGTIRSRISRARQRLRESIQPPLT